MKKEEEKLKSKFGPELNCGCKQRGWELLVTKYSKKRRKYKLPKHKHYMGCALPTNTLEEHIHIMVRSLPGKAGWFLLQQYLEVRDRWVCRHGVNQLFRERTGLLKTGDPRISPYWREMCYWEIGYGKVEYVDINDMSTEVRRYLCSLPLAED